MSKKRALRRSPREAVAYHEAGHAVIANCFEVPFSHVSIEKRDDSRGRVVVKVWIGHGDIGVTAIASPSSPAHLRGGVTRSAQSWLAPCR
jgi:hypothetical protein